MIARRNHYLAIVPPEIILEMAASYLKLSEACALACTNKEYYDIIWMHTTFFSLYVNVNANKESLKHLKGKIPSFEVPWHRMRHMYACHQFAFVQMKWRNLQSLKCISYSLGIASGDIEHYRSLFRRLRGTNLHLKDGSVFPSLVHGYIQYPHERRLCDYEITSRLSYQLGGMPKKTQGLFRFRFKEASMHKRGLIRRENVCIYGLGEIAILNKKTNNIVLVRKDIDAADLSVRDSFLYVKGKRIELT